MADGTGSAFKFRQNGDGIVAHNVHVPSSDARTLKRHLVRFLEKGTKDVHGRLLGAEATHAHHRTAHLNGAWNVNTPCDDQAWC